jgi:Uma2 family endonuclease
MATTAPERSATVTEAAAAPVGDQRVTLRGIGWEGYLTMLRLRGERSVPRMIYCDGDLELVSPSFVHERLAEFLGFFVMVVIEELDIPSALAGHTTFRRRKKSAGVEGDKTFYLANAARVLGKRDIKLRDDPPPDLAIEVVHTHDAARAVEVYRRLGVPEVWVCDEDGLQILLLRADGRYTGSDTSAAFPFLKAAEIFEQVTRPVAGSDTAWMKEVRRWVRDVLAPRRAGPPA